MLRATEVIRGDYAPLPIGLQLPDKDRPIFSHAIVAGARYLVTGDRRHFGKYFDQTFETETGSITVIEPAPLVFYLKSLE